MNISEDFLFVFLIGFTILSILTCLAALVTHIIICIKASLWFLLIAGALFFPVGIIHGFGVWFGVF